MDTDDADSKDFNDHLKEALETDLSDIERTGCVTAGRDLKKNVVILMMPSLGFRTNEKQEVVFRRMLLLFIRKAHELVEEAYTIVYAHVTIDLLNQYPLIYKFYSILPRSYKKNLQKMYVIHPNYGIKMFFEFARVFLSKKFYQKLVLLDSIYEFQKIIPPTALPLPLKFMKKEDDDRGLKYCGVLAPLNEAYIPELGTTPILSVCSQFIRARGGISHAGIFRVPGDEGELNLCKVRLQYATQGSDRIFLSENKDLLLIGDIDNITSINTRNTNSSSSAGSGGGSHHNSKKESTSKRSSAPPSGAKGKAGESTDSNENAAALLPPEAPTSIITISNINTVAQIFKMSIRDLPESLIPYDAYRAMVDLTRRYEVNDLGMEWETQMIKILAALPVCHLSTLVHVVMFIREVVAESETNKMDSKNMAIIFAPTIFRPDMLDPVKAIMELKLAQVLIREILDRHTLLYAAVQQMLMTSASKMTPAETKELLANPVLTSLPVPQPRASYRRVDSRESNNRSVRSLIDGLGDLNTSEEAASLEHLGQNLSPTMIGRLGGSRGRVKTNLSAAELDAASDGEQLERDSRRESRGYGGGDDNVQSELEQVDN